jgi:large subunit ribosomal protein L28
MPAQCAICSKHRRVANNVSHSNIKTPSIQRANLRRVHAKVNGTNTHIKVCTRCLRSGLVTKVA